MLKKRVNHFQEERLANKNLTLKAVLVSSYTKPFGGMVIVFIFTES